MRGGWGILRRLSDIGKWFLVWGLASGAGNLWAQEVGPPPSGPPVPVAPGLGTSPGPVPPAASSAPPLSPAPAPPAGGEVLPPPISSGPLPPSGTVVVPPPSTPFGSGFVTAPPSPPATPPVPYAIWLTTPPPGLFVGLEADIVRPWLRDHGSGDRLDLDWTVTPRITLGYAFAHGGSLQVNYRFLDSGTGFDFSDIGGPLWDFHLQEHWIDLAYYTRPFGPWHNLCLQGQVGMRTAFLHIGSHYEDEVEIEDDRENFWGMGPEVGLRFTWAFGDSGWGLFGDTSVGLLFGRTTARSTQVINFDGGDLPTIFSTSWGSNQTVVDWRGEIGLCWSLPGKPWFRLDFGARGEIFTWDHVTYSNVGPFVRCLLQF